MEQILHKGAQELLQLALQVEIREYVEKYQKELDEQCSRLTVGDGTMSFWSALRGVYPQTKEQRCWVHKTINILDKMPKGIHSPKQKRT